jgi:hypothetical protein
LVKKLSLEELANREISILYVAGCVGVDVPELDGLRSNVKVYCPFGELYHSDGGDESALRLYPDTNTGWCFAEQMFFTPTSLYARAMNLPRQEAARELLDRVNYRPPSFVHLWAEVNEAKVEIDRAALGAALQEFCARVSPAWETKQFEEDTSVVLGKCLDLLLKVETTSDVEAWLGTCKKVMEMQLGR